MTIHARGQYGWPLCGKNYHFVKEGESHVLVMNDGHTSVEFVNRPQEEIVTIDCPECAKDVAERTNGNPVNDLGLSVRCYNCLRNEGILTIEYAEKVSDATLLRIPNFGRKSLAELRAEIKRWRSEYGYARPDRLFDEEFILQDCS